VLNKVLKNRGVVMKEIHLWSDGSSINSGDYKGLGGYGFVLLYGDFSNVDIRTQYCDEKFTMTGYKGFKNTTNQRMEITSIIEGLKRITKYDIPIKVFSDSAYVVNCMNQRWFDKWRSNEWKNSQKEPVENKDLWEELLSIIEDNFLSIKFVKIKGHNNIFYNELADSLARKGLDEVRGSNE
jgi:ribonuclease HI